MRRYRIDIRSDEQWLREVGFMHVESGKLIEMFENENVLPIYLMEASDLKEYVSRFPDGTDECPRGAQGLLDSLTNKADKIKDSIMEGKGTKSDRERWKKEAIDEIKGYYGSAFKVMMENLKDFEAGRRR